MRIGITMNTASAVTAAIALWQMSPLPARMMPCSAMIATVMSTHPSVSPVTRLSCQVRVKTWNSGTCVLKYVMLSALLVLLFYVSVRICVNYSCRRV